MTKILLDGVLQSVSSKFFESLTPGSLRAKGVFETMRSYRGKIFLLDEHIKRLKRGLRFYKIKNPFSQKAIDRNITKVLTANCLKNARVRLSVWREGKNVHSVIVCQRIIKPKKIFTACVVSQKRNRNKYSHLKSVDYSLFQAAYVQAQHRGFDEGILFNRNGYLVEGSRTNMFIVKNGHLYTPGVEHGCLEGITRQWVLHQVKQMKILTQIMPISCKDLLSADEVFVTNSIVGVVPVIKINRHRISSFKPGQITYQIQKSYKKAILAF